jgi:hypothetical protein
MSNLLKYLPFTIVAAVMFGVAIYDGVDPTGAQVRESHVSAPADTPKPPTPDTTKPQTKWLDHLCQGEEIGRPSPYKSPAEQYDRFVTVGAHPKLIDNGDMVTIEVRDVSVIFYRTMAACKAAEAERAAAVERYERSLDKYR